MSNLSGHLYEGQVSNILVDAFQRGHAWNPAYPSLRALDMAAVLKMDGSERDAKDLIASRVSRDINADALVAFYHQGREIQYDGEIGPATLALVQQARCPMPDFAPPPNAAFDFEDPVINAAVKSYQDYAEKYVGGNGAWPVSGCDPDNKGVHSLRVRINPEGAPSNWTASRDKILAAVVASYADMGLSVRYLLDASSAAELTKEFTNLRGGTIGINYFPRGGCSKITGVLSRTYNPADWRYHAELEGHETGHGVGCEHTRGGRMNPSILLTRDPASWRGDPSEPFLKRSYGGVPIPGKEPPPPPPPPDPIGDVVVGRWNEEGRLYEVVRRGYQRPPVIVV